MVKTLGWFQMLTFLFGAVLFCSDLYALDFDKEIRRREVVSVRVASRIQAQRSPQTEKTERKASEEADRQNDPSGTFSVRLISTKR